MRPWLDRVADESGDLSDRWSLTDETRWGLLIGLSFGLQLFDRDTYMCGEERCTKNQNALFIGRTLHEELR